MKKAIALTAVFLVMLLSIVSVFAFPTSGSITVVMINKADKQPLVSQNVTVIKVADCLYNETDITFSLNADFSDTDVDLESSEAAEQLLPVAKEKGIVGETVSSDSEGKAFFAERELGAYLVYSPDGVFSPFIAFVPMVTEDGACFELTAQPKIDIQEEPSTEPAEEPSTEPAEEPSTEPTSETETTTKKDTRTNTDSSSNTGKEKLPQTGMLQYPVPILGLCGVLVFSKGFVLYANSKKEEN
ncbi:MAG: hypothetical protein IJL63_05435 [Clostridia bacterium]|nr:hypothetical protein [Clostridia bacterium]